MGRNVFLGSLLSTASVIVGMPTVAMAQEARQEAGVEDIIVTAQRRSENLQDVPIAITALTATRLNNANIGSTEDLRQVTPGLNIHGLSNVFTPFIRGVGVAFSNPGFDSPIATYVDDVYLTSTVSSTFSLNSIDRIEVLKGPQGTLFGRNATGGVVNVVTKDPSQDREVDFDFGYGNYQTVSTRAYLSGGIAPGVSANVALLYENQNEGWGRNAFDGRDVRKFRNYGGRFKLLFEPGDDTKVRFSGWLNDVHDDRSIYALALGTSGIGGFRRTNGYYDQDSQHGYADRREYGASAKIEHDMGWATITNISAYQNVKLAQPIDSDFTPLPLVNGEIDFKTSAITNELQLASDVTSSLKWIVGLFYLDQKDRDFKVKLSGTNVPGGNVLSADLNTRSFAVFSQATWDLTPTTHLTGGLRYTFDKRRFFNISRTTAAGIQNFASSDASWNKLTYRIALAQDLTDDVMVYASYNRGFNAGGYNLNSPAAPPANPETLDSYELGIKSRVFDRRLQINATAFYMDYQDMHVRSVIPGSLVATAIVNAASARIYGVDLDLEAAVTSRLKLTAAFEYLHATYKKFLLGTISTPRPPQLGGATQVLGDVSGNRLIDAPDFTASIGLSYEMPISSDGSSIKFSSNYYHSSKYHPEVDNFLVQPAFDIVNGSITYSPGPGNIEISAWVKNALDKKYTSGQSSATTAFYYSPSPPRTYGLKIRAKF